MAKLRALDRKPVLLSFFFAVSMMATLLLPVAATSQWLVVGRI
jgi:hypothetical protein